MKTCEGELQRRDQLRRSEAVGERAGQRTLRPMQVRMKRTAATPSHASRRLNSFCVASRQWLRSTKYLMRMLCRATQKHSSSITSASVPASAPPSSCRPPTPRASGKL